VRFANKPEVEKEEIFMSYVSSMLYSFKLQPSCCCSLLFVFFLVVLWISFLSIPPLELIGDKWEGLGCGVVGN
jgi:hypothetical protein